MSHIETMHNEWVGIVLLLTKLNRCHVVQSQVHVEGEEHAQSDEKEQAQEVDNLNEEVFQQEGCGVHNRAECVNKTTSHSSKNKSQACNCIEE